MIYRAPVRETGLAAAVNSLFRRKFREIAAVQGITFEVGAGEVVGFIGPNGAGKTTTLKILSGILVPTAGEARVLGFMPWRREPDFLRQLAMIRGSKPIGGPEEGRMGRLFRLFAGIFVVSLWRELAHRANLFFEILTTAFGISAGLAALGVVYSQTETLAGWSLAEAIVLLGTYQLVSGVLSTFIEPNLIWFSNQVQSGKLDDILLKPVPSIFLSSLGTCAPLALSQIMLGVAVLWVGVGNLETPPPVWNVFGWLSMLVVGIAITWASRVLVASLAFWAPHLALDVLYSALWQCGRYPVDIYRQPIRSILVYMLPVAFISTIPAHFLTRQASLRLLLIGVAAGIGAIIVVRVAWNAGLAQYTSATS